MIQGGDPASIDADPDKPLGSGGPGYQIDAEISEKLVHTYGAIAAARMSDQVNPERKSSGSQFYIVQGGEVDDEMLDRIEMRTGIVYSNEQREEYKTKGGTPFLDMQYTVFGKVISGFDVIDKIAEVETKPGDRPVEDVIMNIRVIK
jgi:peptidyl-prolyl cis-trans isomerase B (cyclophilin B)